MCCGFDCCRGKAESAEPAEIDMLTVAMRSKNCTLLAAVLAILCIITVYIYIYIYKLYIYIYTQLCYIIQLSLDMIHMIICFCGYRHQNHSKPPLPWTLEGQGLDNIAGIERVLAILAPQRFAIPEISCWRVTGLMLNAQAKSLSGAVPTSSLSISRMFTNFLQHALDD